MKMRTFLATLAVGFLATGFTACDDDDDDFVHPAAGEYVGTNKMMVMGSVDEDPNAVVKVISEGEKSVAVVLPESAKSTKAGMSLPSLTLKNLPILSAGGDKFAIALPTDTLKMQAPREDGTKMDIAIWGFAANVEGNKMELTYQIKMGRMPMSLVDVFEGTKK